MEPEENKTADCKLFCFAALAEEFNNTIYFDATGKFLSHRTTEIVTL